uniref:F-box domain-containing protein n=1 Tax=Plectus sambesii TaxID=2011161 RepID=A0A914X777_9BILA
MLSDDLISAAGWLDGLMVLPMWRGSKLPNFNIGDDMLLTMADADHGSSYFCVMGCSGITPGGIRAFIQKWMEKGEPKEGANSTGYRYGDKWDRCTLAFYKCANVTSAAVEEACGDLLKKKATASVYSEEMNDRVIYTTWCRSNNRRLEIFFHIYSMAALQAEVARLQAENDQFRRALVDMNGRIVCGQLTGDLPDNFLEQFSQLPDLPLEQVLRFLPAHQVAQMRHVSHKFNNLIKKCSQTMPKKECNGSVVFKSNHRSELTVEWFDVCGKKITSMTKLAGDKVALSELLRFICIGGRMYFSDGLSAANNVLYQLSKAWLKIRPEVVIFSGDLSQTSQKSLKAFLKKVEPSVKRLHFQDARNIGHNLLSGDVIGAAGRLDGLMVMPMRRGSNLRDINIGDETLLAMADADHMPSYICFMGCSGITPGGIRAFVEKWMKKERLKTDAKSFNSARGLKLCEVTFYNCTNMSLAAVAEACGDLLKKETITGADASPVGAQEEINVVVCYAIHLLSRTRRLEIVFTQQAFRTQFVKEPGEKKVLYIATY